MFVFLVCLIFSLSGCEMKGQKISEWPCFHGPDRTNKSTETGLLSEWPEEGPGIESGRFPGWEKDTVQCP